MNGLGAAGSRRTVYMGEENKPPEEPSTSNGKSETSSSAPTFLMYNKISTTISGKESPTNSTNGNENQKNNKSDSKKKNDQKNRENAIW